MALRYLLFAVAAMLALFSINTLAAANTAEANANFTSALSYVNYVNQSGYLVFSPNLTAAYSDLNRSAGLLNSSPARSINYSQAARQIATKQFSRINSYKAYSIAAVAAFTLIMAALLLFYMKPLKGRRHAR